MSHGSACDADGPESGVLRASYSAAGEMPFKLLRTFVLRGREIIPYHVQLCPTNRCNKNCHWCSCSERDMSLELSFEQIMTAMEKFESLGCRAVTITGGGEPLLHSDFSTMVFAFRNQLRLRLGLVTNGMLIGRHASDFWHNFVWVRVSMSDDRDFGEIEREFEIAAADPLPTDWAISYVLTAEPDYDNLAKAVRFALTHKLTHIRVVADLMDLKNSSPMEKARQELMSRGVSDRLVIWQSRKLFTPGTKRCLISLLKPVIGADGGLYPCCGVQYKDALPSRDLAFNDRMGGIEDIGKIWAYQMYFDGSACERCYYDGYNTVLAGLMSKIRHREFI